MDLLIQLLSALVPKDILISENTGQLWPLKVFRPFCRVSGRKIRCEASVRAMVLKIFTMIADISDQILNTFSSSLVRE